MDIAVTALGATDIETVVAALNVLRSWVPRETGTRLLEAITAIAVDRSRDARVRVAALDALSDLPDDLVRPIREQAPPPEAGDLRSTILWPRAIGSRLMAHEPRSPRCTTRSSRFGMQRAGRRPGVDNASGSGPAVPRITYWRTEGAASRCMTRARRSAPRRIRCRRVLSRRWRVLATRLASSHSRARGRRRETLDGALSCQRLRDRL